jgi:hypothetical protein
MDKKEEMERIAKVGDIIRTTKDIRWTDYENRDHYVPSGTDAEVIKVIPEIDSWEVQARKRSREPVFLVERGEFTVIKIKHGLSGEFRTATTEDLYNMWDKGKGRVMIKFYESLESETPYIVERWTDWFDIPREFQDAIFETYTDRMDDIVVIKAYMKKRR